MSSRIEEAISRVLQIRQDDIIIAFVGLTGAGKSTFVHLLVNEDQHSKEEIGHGLTSRTNCVLATRVRGHPLHGDRIILLDTPGFNDTHKSDEKTIKLILEWLKENYQKQGIKLDGIIFLRDITKNRATNSSNLCLESANKICKEAGGVLHFVTTMWELEDKIQGKERETDLKVHEWGRYLTESGLPPDRLNKQEPREAWRVVEQLISHGHRKKVQEIKEELDDLERDFSDIPSTKVLYHRLKTLIERNSGNASSLDSSDEYERIRGEIQELKIPLSRWRWLRALLSGELWRAKDVKTNDSRLGIGD